MTDFAQLLNCLTTGNVEFIVISGFAPAAHGSAHLTFDLDVGAREVSPVAGIECPSICPDSG